MLEDKLLIYRFKRGNADAFCRIYDKYADILLTLAVNLLGDLHNAEDVVQDVFVRFAGSAGLFELTGNLRGYLSKCVVNRCRDVVRKKIQHPNVSIEQMQEATSNSNGPIGTAIANEQLEQLRWCMDKLSYEQKEVVALRLHGDLKFREIAKLQQISVKTAISRYRYGLDKLRSLLDGEVI